MTESDPADCHTFEAASSIFKENQALLTKQKRQVPSYNSSVFMVSENGIEPPTRGFLIPNPRGVSVVNVRVNGRKQRAV